MKVSENHIIGQVVAEDYRTASVFKYHKIDFCCKGNRSIKDVCLKKNIDPNLILKEIENATQDNTNNKEDFTNWDLDLLADYIEKKHHRYVLSKIPELKAYLNKVARVHGARHPELLEIEQLFMASAENLLSHMQKEERILFPYIRQLRQAELRQNGFRQPPFGTIENPIQMMMHEHDHEGERFRQIAMLTDNYTPPVDACTTYRVSFLLLQEFEADLHHHIHLENNILFPKAIELEQSLKVQH